MKKTFRRLLAILLLTSLMSVSAQAQTLEETARQVARQYDAKVLSAQTVVQGNQRVHVIKLLTRDGVVKTVRVPAK